MEINIINEAGIIESAEKKRFSHELYFLINEKKDDTDLIHHLARRIVNMAIKILNSPRLCICHRCMFVVEDDKLILDLKMKRITLLENISKYHPCTEALLGEIQDRFTISFFGKEDF